MADEPDPPRRFYQLKPREFEALNAPVPSTPAASGTPAAATGKIDVREIFQQAQTPGPILKPGQSVTAKNEIHQVLEHNLARANAAGLNELAPKPKRASRRKRDYFLVLIPLDIFFACAAFGPYSNVATMAYGVAGIIICTLGLTWIMFFVMDDY